MSTAAHDTIRALTARGLWPDEIAAQVGCSLSAVERVLRAPSAPAGTARLGRPPAFGALAPDVVRDLAHATIAVTTAGRIAHPPVVKAFYTRARREPETLPAGVAERVLAGGKLPVALTRQVRQLVTQDMLNAARGRKRMILRGAVSPLDNTYIDEEGARVPLLPGDLFNADDMHCNAPYYTVDAAGVHISRAQLLAVQDVSSLRFVHFGLWAMSNDAYGKFAIMRLLEECMRDVGVPRLGWYLEHGSWDSHLVNDSLRAVCRGVWHAQTSKGKPVEAAFNQFQEYMSIHFRAAGFELGRLRGEFEEGKKLWMDCRSGKRDPRDLGVPSMAQMLEIINACMADYNAKVSHGRKLQGRSPDTAWGAAPPLPALAEADTWRLKPVSNAVALRNGVAEAKCDTFGKQGYWYGNAELFGRLGPGYRVELRWDPADPERAAVFNRETRERVKTRGWLLEVMPEAFAGRWTPGQLLSAVAEGEFLGFATPVAPMPKLVLADWSHWHDGHEYRKEYHRTAWGMFRAVTKGEQERVRRIVEHHAGFGDGERVEAVSVDPLATREARLAVESVAAPTSGGTPAAIRETRALPKVTRISRGETAAPVQPARGRELTDRLFGRAEDIFGEAIAAAPNPHGDGIPF